METRFACCRPDSFQLLMGHREQLIFAIVPNLVLVQLLGQFPELLLLSSRSRNVAILGPSRTDLVRHTEFMLKVCHSAFSVLRCSKISAGLHGAHADEVSRPNGAAFRWRQDLPESSSSTDFQLQWVPRLHAQSSTIVKLEDLVLVQNY